MKRISFLIIAILLIQVKLHAQNGNAGIGTTSPDPSAKLDIVSDSLGFLCPRMTSAQRASIVNPAAGLLVYDNETQSHWFFNGTLWQNLVPEPVEIPSQLVFSFLSQSGVAGVGETVLGSYVIPASTLEQDGELLEVHAFGFAAADSGVFRFKLLSQELLFSVNEPGAWEARLSIYRAPGNNCKFSGSLISAGGATSTYSVAQQDFSLAQPFQITAEQFTALPNGLSLEGFSIRVVR
jgi:hypothetical protein